MKKITRPTEMTLYLKRNLVFFRFSSSIGYIYIYIKIKQIRNLIEIFSALSIF